MVCILRRNPALDLTTFHDHWLHHHGGLFQEVDELNEPLLAYEQNHGLDLADAAYDGVTEQWFTSYDTFLGSLGVEAVEREVNPDVAYMLDPTSIEFVMAGPPTVASGGAAAYEQARFGCPAPGALFHVHDRDALGWLELQVKSVAVPLHVQVTSSESVNPGMPVQSPLKYVSWSTK